MAEYNERSVAVRRVMETKWERGVDNTDAIAEEIADVYIMLNQMEILHKVEDRVMWWFNAKLARLECRLKGAGEDAGTGN